MVQEETILVTGEEQKVLRLKCHKKRVIGLQFLAEKSDKTHGRQHGWPAFSLNIESG